MRARNLDLGGAFAFVCYGILALALIAALGVFVYGRILTGIADGKQVELKQAQSDIDVATVKSFVDLHDRLASGKQLLNGHVAFSGLFDLIEELTPTTVRLKSMHLALTDLHTATLAAVGTASSFNALAVLSTVLGKDGHIKDAIFSGIAVEKGGGVSFSFSATIDPALIAFSGVASAGMSATTTP